MIIVINDNLGTHTCCGRTPCTAYHMHCHVYNTLSVSRACSRAYWLRRGRPANFEVTPVVTARETCRSAARPRAGPPLRTEQDFSGLPAPRELGQDSPAPDKAFKIGLASQPLHFRIGHCAKAIADSKPLAQPGATEPSVVPSCTGSAGQPGSLAGSQLLVRVFPGCVLELPVPTQYQYSGVSRF